MVAASFALALFAAQAAAPKVGIWTDSAACRAGLRPLVRAAGGETVAAPRDRPAERFQDLRSGIRAQHRRRGVAVVLTVHPSAGPAQVVGAYRGVDGRLLGLRRFSGRSCRPRPADARRLVRWLQKTLARSPSPKQADAAVAAAPLDGTVRTLGGAGPVSAAGFRVGLLGALDHRSFVWRGPREGQLRDLRMSALPRLGLSLAAGDASLGGALTLLHSVGARAEGPSRPSVGVAHFTAGLRGWKSLLLSGGTRLFGAVRADFDRYQVGAGRSGMPTWTALVPGLSGGVAHRLDSRLLVTAELGPIVHLGSARLDGRPALSVNGAVGGRGALSFRLMLTADTDLELGAAVQRTAFSAASQWAEGADGAVDTRGQVRLGLRWAPAR